MVEIHLAGTLVRASHVEGLEGAELVEADDVGTLGLILKQREHELRGCILGRREEGGVKSRDTARVSVGVRIGVKNRVRGRVRGRVRVRARSLASWSVGTHMWQV